MSTAFLAVAAMTLLGLLTLSWLAVPSSPDLDGERLFKAILVTLLRGEVDAVDGAAADWEEKVLRWVPYHPAGRMPEAKLTSPSLHSLLGPALDGEQGLIEALVQCDTYAERLERMYDKDEAGLEARFSDPADLGESYDPARTVAPAVSWEAIAAWGGGDPAVQEWLGIQTELTWVLVGGRSDGLALPSILQALATDLGEKAIVVPVDHADEEGGRAAVGDAAADVLETAAHRVIFVGEEAGIQFILAALVASAPLRDRVLAVVSVGGVLGCLEEEGSLSHAVLSDWMDAWFQHRSLDTEIIRYTPYICLQWLDRTTLPPGVPALPMAASRFPEPKQDSSVPPAVQVVDLGPLWATESTPVVQIARALQTFLACWLSR
jgi:hypothetical protein